MKVISAKEIQPTVRTKKFLIKLSKMNFENYKTNSVEDKTTDETTNQTSANQADTASYEYNELPSGVINCTCPPQHHLNVQIQEDHSWAAEEHMEWLRFNLDPYYPLLNNQVRADEAQMRSEPVSTESSDDLPTGDSSDSESEADDDDDQQVPSGVMALWQMLRDDDVGVVVDVDENNNEVDMNNNYW